MSTKFNIRTMEQPLEPEWVNDADPCPTEDITGMCPRCYEHTSLCEPCCPSGTPRDEQSNLSSDDCTCQDAVAS